MQVRIMHVRMTYLELDVDVDVVGDEDPLSTNNSIVPMTTKVIGASQQPKNPLHRGCGAGCGGGIGGGGPGGSGPGCGMGPGCGGMGLGTICLMIGLRRLQGRICRVAL
jgi:hypothetical protein